MTGEAYTCKPYLFGLNVSSKEKWFFRLSLYIYREFCHGQL